MRDLQCARRSCILLRFSFLTSKYVNHQYQTERGLYWCKVHIRRLVRALVLAPRPSLTDILHPWPSNLMPLRCTIQSLARRESNMGGSRIR